MSLIGDVCLSLLAFVLMNINFLDLVHLAVPVSVVLIAQLVVMFLYGWLVTFRVCGKNYDAAVLVAGQCGFAYNKHSLVISTRVHALESK